MRSATIDRFAALVLMAVLGWAGAARAEPTINPQDLVVAADHIRAPERSFRLANTLIEYANGEARNRSVLAVFAKLNQTTNQFRNVVRYVDPPRDVGKMVLMDAAKMWFYDPASKASVPLSPEQRLIGQASAADIVTANLGRDYKAAIVGEESLLDGDRQSRNCWHLDLAASTDDAMYGRVEYWLEKNTSRPVKAKFYADGGRLLKITYYRRYQVELGELRPTETVIIDAVDTSQVTVMSSSDWTWQEIPDAWFQRDYLPRLKIEQ